MAVAVSSTNADSDAIRLIRDAERSPLHRHVASRARDKAIMGLYDDPRTNGRLTEAQWEQVVTRAARESLDNYELCRTAWGNVPEILS